ncbi:hypothetical protein JYP52_07430 [Nitratireductor aquibiodomus]|uniref:hypothetical protein n=1 Tax=Nitratireductor aquibiodomus TaxID=204799 RepID=UPI0019D38954|nr:hypothetical protein [Nitratireductor aquibiodomus]MBN7760963.1 hypothetical protein [Nitratireductor aquibiodomus]
MKQRKRRVSARQKDLLESAWEKAPERIRSPKVSVRDSILSIIRAEVAKRDGETLQLQAIGYVQEHFPPQEQTAKSVTKVERWLRDPAGRRPPTPSDRVGAKEVRQSGSSSEEEGE